jgi:Flp pilus assembly protein TadG
MRTSGLDRDLAGNRNGSAAIEFGMLLPVFMVATMGVIEFGSYLTTQQALIESVHAGGRYAVVHGSQRSNPATSASLQSLVQNGSTLLTPSQVSVTVTFSPNNNPGSTVNIVGSYQWAPLVPLVMLPTVTINAKSISTILN